MAYFASSLGFAVLTVVLSSTVLILVVSPPRPEPASHFLGVDADLSKTEGRVLKYEFRGNRNSSNCLLWSHGLLSSRYETLGLNEDILARLDAYAVTIDRPGYGESSHHLGRDFASYVADVEALADHLEIFKFFVVGVSAGGPYALATAAMLPKRVRGALLLSAAGPCGMVAREAAEREFSEHRGTVEGMLRRELSKQSWAAAVFKMFAETYVGGRILYSLWLENVGQTIFSRMSDIDTKCLMQRRQRSAYSLKILPESIKQGSATPVIQDLMLVLRPWAFQIDQMPKALVAATHIWHATGDKQVPVDCAHSFHEMLPAAKLKIVEKGGHYAYWVCDEGAQQEMLSQLIKGGIP